MKILIAPDSFKGNLTGKEVAQVMVKAARKTYPKAELIEMPFSDGGEGAIDVLMQAGLGNIHTAKSVDPLNRPIHASYFIFNDATTAWVELSQSSGLTLLKKHERNPLETTTWGTGLLIKDALKKGCKKIIVGVGGSATHDMGTGIFRALGGTLLDADEKEIPLGGGYLGQCKHICSDTLIKPLKTGSITVASDVTNPLLGKTGAAFTYAPQKGADKKQVRILEKNSRHFSNLLYEHTGKHTANLPGAGAAGGTTAGLMALLGASVENGFSILASKTGLESHVKTASLVITGEGRYDSQSAYGKITHRMAKMAKDCGVPCFILAGSVIQNAPSAVQETPLIFEVTPKEMPLAQAFTKAESLLYEKLCRVLTAVKNKTILLNP